MGVSEATKSVPMVQAIPWMAGTLASFSAMALSIRILSTDMGLFQILFYRSAVGLVVVTAVACFLTDGRRALQVRQPRAHVLRNLIHFCGQWCWAAGIAYLPLATVFALEFTTPVWSAILAVLLLRERLNLGRMVMIGLGFLGVLVVLRPGLTLFDPTTGIVLTAAFCYAGAHTLTKRLMSTDRALSVLFWMSLIQLPLGLALGTVDWKTPERDDFIPILVLGLAGLSAHYCLARAFKLADATVVVPLDFLRLPLIALLGFLFFDEPIEFFVLLGGGVIVAGIWAGISYERKHHSPT